MLRVRPDTMTISAAVGADEKLKALRAAMKSYEWVTDHIKLFEPRECDLSLDTLSSVASKHLVAIENCMSVDASDPEADQMKNLIILKR